MFGWSDGVIAGETAGETEAETETAETETRKSDGDEDQSPSFRGILSDGSGGLDKTSLPEWYWYGEVDRIGRRSVGDR